MSKVLLEIQGLHKQYGNVEVLKGVDCTMQEGEVISIIGSSGSGKTTMLRCINMLEDFQGGHIRLAGEEIGYEHSGTSRKRKSEKEIARQRALTGMAFQQFNLFPHLTALENVMVAQYYHSMPDEAEARAALERVGMGARATHLPRQMSGGEQQRVCVARALINAPSVVLADEPTGNLDEANEKIVLDLFRQLHDEGTTLIVVTHDAMVAAQGQRQVILNHGRIAEVIETDDYHRAFGTAGAAS